MGWSFCTVVLEYTDVSGSLCSSSCDSGSVTLLMLAYVMSCLLINEHLIWFDFDLIPLPSHDLKKFVEACLPLSFCPFFLLPLPVLPLLTSHPLSYFLSLSSPFSIFLLLPAAKHPQMQLGCVRVLHWVQGRAIAAKCRWNLNYMNWYNNLRRICNDDKRLKLTNWHSCSSTEFEIWSHVFQIWKHEHARRHWHVKLAPAHFQAQYVLVMWSWTNGVKASSRL